MCLYSAQLGYGFQLFIANGVTWHWENLIVFRHALVLLYNLLGNVQQTDIRFGVGLLSSGDNPKIAVKECLKIVGSKVLDIGICQTGEHRK